MAHTTSMQAISSPSVILRSTASAIQLNTWRSFVGSSRRPQLLRAFVGTYTVMQLRSVMNRVTADNGQLQRGGIQLNSLAVANDRNRVSVAVLTC
jgi:hypothetical protein